jgi:YbbR domain-containing protein
MMFDPKPGERTFNLSAQNVRVPRDIHIVQIVPAELQISFDWRKTRTVEVKPRVIGTLVSGLAISGVTVEPPQITITGPRGHVDAVEAATTDPVDATGVLNRSSFTTNAYVADPLVQVVHPQPVRVIVTVGKSTTSTGN